MLAKQKHTLVSQREVHDEENQTLYAGRKPKLIGTPRGVGGGGVGGLNTYNRDLNNAIFKEV